MSITDAKQQLADLLAAAGVDALPYVPEEFPGGVVAIVDGAENYLTGGETFETDAGEAWLALTLYVLADLSGGNQQAIEDLDTALGRVLPALTGSAWAYDPAGRPGAFHTANWLAHGVAIPVTNLITLTT